MSHTAVQTSLSQTKYQYESSFGNTRDEVKPLNVFKKQKIILQNKHSSVSLCSKNSFISIYTFSNTCLTPAKANEVKKRKKIALDTKFQNSKCCSVQDLHY